MSIRLDKRNYRKHSDKNKRLIRRSLEDCGAGRSIVIDKNDEVIAGNGVYEQAKDMNLGIRVVETDGTELIVIKRTDLSSKDDKRTKLAILDNSTSDTSEMDYALLQKDFELVNLMDMGVDPVNLDIESDDSEIVFDNLPEEIDGMSLEADELEDIKGEDTTATERLVITFMPEEKSELENLLGLVVNKIVFEAGEIFKENGI